MNYTNHLLSLLPYIIIIIIITITITTTETITITIAITTIIITIITITIIIYLLFSSVVIYLLFSSVAISFPISKKWFWAPLAIDQSDPQDCFGLMPQGWDPYTLKRIQYVNSSPCKISSCPMGKVSSRQRGSFPVP